MRVILGETVAIMVNFMGRIFFVMSSRTMCSQSIMAVLIVDLHLLALGSIGKLELSCSCNQIEKSTVFQQYTILHCAGNSSLIGIQLKLRTTGGKVATALADRRRIVVPFSVPRSV